KTLNSGFQTATFTHANGVEPASAFTATISWGDGTTSPGIITQSGTTYTVASTSSHTYTSGNNHTITTSVTETGNSPLSEGGDKFDADPGSLPVGERDVVQLPQDSGKHSGGQNDSS